MSNIGKYNIVPFKVFPKQAFRYAKLLVQGIFPQGLDLQDVSALSLLAALISRLCAVTSHN